MEDDQIVEFGEDRIKRGKDGKVIHHPLNGPYRFPTGEDMPSYGHLTFGGHDLPKSPILGGVRVFYLEFFGEPTPVLYREAWADPLRIEVLQRLSQHNKSWYLSCVGTYLNTSSPDGYMPIVGELQQEFFKGQEPSFAVVQSEIQFGYGKGFHPRFFFEVPNQLLPRVVQKYWATAIPGWPMEGYNMASGQIQLLSEWDKRPRDDRLFRDVMDEVQVAFYTYPAEHRHLVFVTNKLDLGEMRRLLDLESLRRHAEKICKTTENENITENSSEQDV